ncbi:hypothetical protein AAG906_012524 [Vitis piasezkii]
MEFHEFGAFHIFIDSEECFQVLKDGMQALSAKLLWDVWMNCHMLGRGSQGSGSNGHGPGHGRGRGRGRGHGHGSYNAKNQKNLGMVQNPPSRAASSGGWGSWCRSKASDNNQGGGAGTDGWGMTRLVEAMGVVPGARSSGPCTWGNDRANWEGQQQ